MFKNYKISIWACKNQCPMTLETRVVFLTPTPTDSPVLLNMNTLKLKIFLYTANMKNVLARCILQYKLLTSILYSIHVNTMMNVITVIDFM
jgi:hypothetical protein